MLVCMRGLVVGFGLGFIVAAQAGPISVFLVRATLRGTLRTGLAIGAGIATVDLLYSAVGAAGVGPMLSVRPMRLLLGAAGAATLAYLGIRRLWTAMRIRAGGDLPGETTTPRRAHGTALAATASNPLTIASWAALFAGASVAGMTRTAADGAGLVLGVGLGSRGGGRGTPGAGPVGDPARIHRGSRSAARPPPSGPRLTRRVTDLS